MKEKISSKVLGVALVCLMTVSTLGILPSIVNASSTTHLLDISTDYNPAQTRATQSLPVTSQSPSSPATGTWEVIATIQLSGTERPLQIAVGGGKAYVSRNPGHLTILDLSTNTVVTTISFGPYPGSAPHYIGVSGGKAYVALGNLGSDGQLAVIDMANNTVTAYIPVGADPHGVATIGQRVYVTNNVWWSSGDPATVKVVDTNTNSVVATIPVGINPTSIAVDPVSRKAYVTNHNDLSKSVSVINTTSNSVTTTIPINNPPAGVAISGNRAYVSTTVNMPNGTAEVINIGSDSVVSSIPVGRDSWGIAASGSHVFVANQASSTVSVIDVATNSVVATVNVGDDPTSIAVDPSTEKVYVTNQGDRTVSIIQFKETPPPSNQLPTVSITSPPNNATVSGTVSVLGTASDPDGSSQLQRVEVKIDTGSWTQASGTASWSYSWNTTTVPNGQHSIRARSYDGQAHSSEASIVVSVNNQVSTPSIVAVGISSEAVPQPPRTFLEAKPGDRINTWYDIGYSGPRIAVRLRTTLVDPSGNAVSNPLGDPLLTLMEDLPGHTGWVGVSFDIPAEAIQGAYDVRFSVWSEDGAQEYDAVVKHDWLSLGAQKVPDIGSVGSIDFGNVTVDDSLDRTTTIYNAGNATLTINSITRISGSADFAYVGPSTPFDIGAGSSQTITLRFAPSSKGLKSVVFSINSNDSDEANITFTVSGNGVIQTGAINVTSEPSGASFTITGPANYSGITPWSTTNAPSGTYTITWAPMSGYQTPPQQSKTLTQGGAISFHGNYQLSTGIIQVTSEPSGASFALSGPKAYSGITPWSTTDAPSGSYIVTWNPIQGYETPSEDSKTLTQGGTISFHELYQQVKGTIEVTSDPSGASFTLSGPANYSGVTPWRKTDAPVGSYTVTWGFLKGYETPSQEAKSLTGGETISFYGLYKPGTGSITLDSDPPGASFTLSGPENYRGVTPWSKTDAPKGTYTVTWGFMGGYETPPQDSKTLTQGGMLSFYGDYTVEEPFLGANAATLWDYYSAWSKQLPPLSERAKIYEALGLGSAESYTGTAEQNTRLLNALKERQICPSTADEIIGVASGTTIARLIKDETQERTLIIVDSEEYYIVTLKRYIEPEKLQTFSEPSGWKMYVDSTGQPVSDEETLQRISFVKKANHLMSTVGSPVEIGKKLDLIDEVLKAHEDLTNAEMVAFIAKELAFITVDIAIVAGTGGAATPIASLDIGRMLSGIVLGVEKQYTDAERLRADLGGGLLDAAKVHYKEADRISREQWAVTLKIDESGDLALEQENFKRVTDSQRAREFLEHFYTAYLTEVYGKGLVLPDGRISKSAFLEVLGWVPEYIGDKISHKITSIFQLGKNLMEYPSSLGEYLQRINDVSSKVEELMVEPGRWAQYTLALAHQDISFLKEVPLEPYIYAHVASPVELRVRDTEGRTTGIIDGEIRIDIPRSYYSGGDVIIFSPSDSYEYEAAGTSKGSYDLTVTTVAEQTNTFSLANVPTLSGTLHQYTINWDALAKGKKGVTMKIDADGDGTFEEVQYLGQEQKGFPWVWIVVAGVSGLVGVFVGAFLVRRRMSERKF